MKDLEKMLIDRRNELETMIENANKCIDGAPEGRLEILTQNGHYRYYLCNGSTAHKALVRSYIPKAEEKLAALIAQRDYAKKILNYAVSEKSKIDALLQVYSPRETQEIYERLHPGRKAIVTPLLMSDDGYARKWKAASPEPLCVNSFPVQSEIYTENNEHVRSKSEKIIADKLSLMGIPYKYEQALALKEKVVFPDFTVLNKRSRKIYYWEHLGMVDSEAYIEKSFEKISLYEYNGIIPGKNLILTHETKSRPLSVKVLDEVINTFLI